MANKDSNQTNEPKVIISNSLKRQKIIRVLLIVLIPALVLFLITFLIILGLNYSGPEVAKPKLLIVCPSLEEFCQNFRPIIKLGRYLGIGANIKEGSPVYAVFDGSIQVRTTTGATSSASLKGQREVLTHLTLTNQDKTAKAIYIFNSPPTITKYQFKKGEEMLKITKEGMFSFAGYNLLINLTDGKDQTLYLDKFTFKTN